MKKQSINNNKTIKVKATKDLFISMLVKDLTLNDVISDLVDNSVDAANNNKGTSNDLSEFFVELTIQKGKFIIYDNCGGITSDVARESAFVFGKPEHYSNSDFSIGQYGIGMKRAFFKIGNNIEIESKSKESYFKVNINVGDWRKEDNWDFSFSEIKEGMNNRLKDTYTKIVITEIHDEINERLISTTFQKIRGELSYEQMINLNNGLNLILNESKIIEPELSIISNELIKPRIWEQEFPKGLRVNVIAGISDADTNKGGWYIFCNNRMVLGPERSEITGWSKKGSLGMPQYHSQYNRFRGFVFFSAKDSSLLPWNTTKTSMDLDSKNFIFVKEKLIEFGLEIKNSLDSVKKERDLDVEKREMEKYFEEVKSIDIYKYMNSESSKDSSNYVFPYEKIAKKNINNDEIRITYFRPKEQVEKIKKFINKNENKEVGKYTFDYFYQNEVD